MTWSYKLRRLRSSTVRPSAPSESARFASHSASGTKYAEKWPRLAGAPMLPRRMERIHEVSSAAAVVDTCDGACTGRE